MTDREELRIKQLEEETRHEHAMRLLQGTRLDAHDASLSGVDATLATVGERLDQITVQIQQLTVAQATTQTMLQDLIRVIAKEHSNGGGKG